MKKLSDELTLCPPPYATQTEPPGVVGDSYATPTAPPGHLNPPVPRDQFAIKEKADDSSIKQRLRTIKKDKKPGHKKSEYKSEESESEDSIDVNPMVEVPSADGIPRYVFRPWSLKDVKEVGEQITSHKEDPEKWTDDMVDVVKSYRLNGHELGQVMAASLWKDWHRAAANYTGRDEAGVVLQFQNNFQGTLKEQFDVVTSSYTV